MADRTEILARVRETDRAGARYAAAYRALVQPDMDSLYPIVRGYVLDRFLIPRELCPGDKLLDLADVSLRHILRMKKQGIYIGDISRACSGASSVISKKVLLMKAVQEDFGVSMTPAQSAGITTVTELTAFLLTKGARHDHG